MKEGMGHKIIRVILLILIVIFFILDCGVIVFVFKNVPIGETEYSSFQEFRDAGAAGYMYMPEKATEQKYYLSYTGFYLHSIYSFCLEDKEAYDAYMEHLKDYSCTESDVAHPAWDWYSQYEPTNEELEQMDYLQSNYMNMGYKEVLDISRIDKGFANAYGASVSEFVDLEYSLGNFPISMPFDKVIPDEVETYTILYYRPKDTGTRAEGILVNEATRRFVVFYLGAAR